MQKARDIAVYLYAVFDELAKVRLRHAVGVPVVRLARQHQPVGLLQVLNGVVERNEARPRDRPLHLARGEGLVVEILVQPDVRVHVEDLLRQKILQLFFVDPAIIRRDFK